MEPATSVLAMIQNHQDNNNSRITGVKEIPKTKIEEDINSSTNKTKVMLINSQRTQISCSGNRTQMILSILRQPKRTKVRSALVEIKMMIAKMVNPRGVALIMLMLNKISHLQFKWVDLQEEEEIHKLLRV